MHVADWSPDGQTMAVVSFAGGRYRLEYPIGKVLYEPPGWITYARISPKGDRIAFLDHHGSVTSAVRWPLSIAAGQEDDALVRSGSHCRDSRGRAAATRSGSPARAAGRAAALRCTR